MHKEWRSGRKGGEEGRGGASRGIGGGIGPKIRKKQEQVGKKEVQVKEQFGRLRLTKKRRKVMRSGLAA
eukprot:1074182-Heterocapsa_arctica.AAC.1